MLEVVEIELHGRYIVFLYAVIRGLVVERVWEGDDQHNNADR